MAVDQKIGIFTTRMRTEFQIAYAATAKPAKWERFTQIIPSDARIEHYTWMSPSPGLALYQGYRRFAKLDVIKYSVENLEYDAGFEVMLRDIKDDMTGGYSIKPQELAARAKLFPGRLSLKALALGTSKLCFDGTAFFANSHTIGTGDNLLTGTGTGNSDGLTYRMVLLHNGGTLKPLICQTRMAPEFRTDAGTPQSDLAKVAKYWIDTELAACYGYWWDAIHYTWTNRPSLTDMHTAYGDIVTAMRGFVLPKSLSSEDGEYMHEQTEFNSDAMTLVVTPALERVAFQSINAETVPAIVGAIGVANNNLWKGFADVVTTNFL